MMTICSWITFSQQPDIFPTTFTWRHFSLVFPSQRRLSTPAKRANIYRQGAIRKGESAEGGWRLVGIGKTAKPRT